MKILIVRLSAIGDIIHSAVVLEFIKKYSPDTQIDWLVDSAFSGILEHNPNIRKILTIDLKKLKSNKSFKNLLSILNQIKQIKRENYDFVIDLQGLLKSAIVSRLISKNIIGYSFSSAKEGIASLFYTKKVISDYSENKILRNIFVINSAFNLNISADEVKNKQPHLFYSTSDNLISAENKVVFVVGSSMEQKNYPKEKFLQLANLINEEIFIIWGNEQEKEIAKWLENQSQKIKSAPKMNLNQLKYFISTAKIVIGNDTGPTHIAWAMNKPSIIIFGLTPVEQAFQTKINKIIKSKTKVNHRKIDKKDFSIKTIPPENIYKIYLSFQFENF